MTIGWKPFSNDPHVASSRLRCRAPIVLLRRTGFPVEIYQEKNRSDYRVVIFQKLYDAKHQALALQLQAQGTRVVLDLCDNYLYTAIDDVNLSIRAESLRRMLDIADIVTVSTKTLAEYLSRPAYVIRDGIEPHVPRTILDRAVRRRRRQGRLELLWFGIWGNAQISFGMRDLLGVSDVLQDLAARTSVRLTILSNSLEAFTEWIAPLALSTRYLEWQDHNHLCRLLTRHDACLIPIQRNPYTDCKSPNRLALALSLGIPVIATSIPSYEEFASFCCLDDWEGGLREAEKGGDAWYARAEEGRAYVLQHHMLKHAADEWRDLLASLLSEDIPVQPAISP